MNLSGDQIFHSPFRTLSNNRKQFDGLRINIYAKNMCG